MKIYFVTSSSFVFDPEKCPFNPDTTYYLDDVKYIAWRDYFKFGVQGSSIIGSATYNSSLDLTEFQADSQGKQFVLDLSNVLYLDVDGTTIWNLDD